MSIKDKLTSRKLWLSIAAMLSSIAVSVNGIATSNDIIVTIGIICTVVSAAIYAACEAYVDAAATNGVITVQTEETAENNGEE